MNNTLNKTDNISNTFSTVKNKEPDSLSWNVLFPNGFFFEPDGSRSSDEWLADSLITDLAALRIMTAGQLFRWIKMKDPLKGTDEIETFIAALFRHQFIEKEVYSIPVPQSRRIRIHENETEKTTVIYLNEKAKPHLSVSSAARFARFGPPEGIDLERLYHDILVAESVLMLGRDHLICRIKSETELKSEAGKTLVNGSKTVPDFQVLLAKWDKTGEPSFFAVVCGEVVVQTTAAQNAAKPAGIIYFTANLRAADLIESVAGHPANLLDDPALPAEGELAMRAAYDVVYNPGNALLRSRFRIFRQHDLLDRGNYYAIMIHLHNYGPLTASALSQLTGTGRENISRQLKQLTALGILHYEAVQSAPGKQLGSPEKLFAFAGVSLVNYEFRLKQLGISQSIAQD